MPICAQFTHLSTRTFSQLAPGRDFHAALVSFQGGESTTFHDHDFHEVMLVLEGAAGHRISTQRVAIAAGDLVLVRPHDLHQIVIPAGGRIRFVNVAFRSELWREFGEVAGAGRDRAGWDSGSLPPAERLSEIDRRALTVEMDRVLAAFHGSAGRLDLIRLWSLVLSCLLPAPPPSVLYPASTEAPPDWLLAAREAMYEPDNLRAGVARFVALSGVTHGHLSRTLQRYQGETPTTVVNELRLRRAALILASTQTPVGEVANLCGFDNVSYFHRRFRARFGHTPRAFRSLPGRLIAPLAGKPEPR